MAYYSYGLLSNTASGVFDIRGDTGFSNYMAGGGQINNVGLFKKSAGSGISNIAWALSNSGTVEVQSGTLNLAGSVTQLSGGTLTGGTWIVAGSSTLAITTGSNITTNQGNVTLDGPGSTFANIGTLANNQDTFTITRGCNFTTVGALANSGTIGVGNSSTLTVNGNLNQTAGNLSLDNGGTLTAGTVAIAGGTLTAGGPNATIIGSVLYSSPASSTFQGGISGNGNRLVLNNPAAVLILSGTDTYRGGTVVTAGTLILTNGEAIADGTSLTVGNAAAFGFVNSELAISPTPSLTPVPEPGTLALLVAGAALMTMFRKRR